MDGAALTRLSDCAVNFESCVAGHGDNLAHDKVTSVPPLGLLRLSRITIHKGHLCEIWTVVGPLTVLKRRLGVVLHFRF